MDERKSSVKYEVMDESMQWVSPPEGSVIVPVLEESDVSPVAGKPGFRKMYLAAGAALLSAVSMGMAITYSSPATADMKSKHLVNDEQISWIGSLLALGALFGGVSAGPLTEKLGRKSTILWCSLPFVIGWLIIIYAKSVATILAGRFITGFCCGLVTVTAPMYVVEISTSDVRGLLGACFQLFVTIGVLLTTSLGAALAWTWLGVACLLIVVLSLIAIMRMPESPRWLVARGRNEAAVAAIKYLQGTYLDASKECETIQEDLRLQPKGHLTWKEFCQPAIYKPALLSFGLMFFQQLSGVNDIIFYSVAIFESSGSLDPFIGTIVVASVQVVCTLASSVLLDRMGRRILLMISGGGMTFSMALLGSYGMMVELNHALQATYGWMPLASLVIFVTFFSLGYGPIPWLMMAEMVPVRARSVVSAVGTGFNWLLVFLLTKSFDSMLKIFHQYGTYWSFSAICFLSCFFVWFFLPETKGRPLEEIQMFFTGKEANKTKSPSSSTCVKE